MPGRRLALALGLGLGQRLLLALCAAALLLLLTAGSWSPGRRRPSPPSPPPPAPPPAAPDTSARSPKRDRPGCCREPSLQHGHHRSLRWHIELQPWASPQHSLEDEAARFLVYISTTQVDCSEVAERGMTERPEEMQDPWAVCLDNTFQLAQQMQSQRCRIYSVGLRSGDRGFEEGMSMAGCEVHYLDPSVREAHLQQSQGYWHHRLALDWREPNPSTSDHHRAVSTKKLAAIMQRFGHSKIDVLKADVESAEWKILENLILENVVEDIGQLVLAVHLHWAGFEVSGSDSDVVRYWYSLLKELELRGFKLFRSYKNMSKPQVFLQREAFNASSSYTLSWVNTQWVQR